MPSCLGYRSRRVLNPATEIIGSTTRQIVDCLNASLADRLERVAVRFEADHPTLASSSRRLIDLLGKAGL